MACVYYRHEAAGMGLKQDTLVGENVTTAGELKVYVKGELEKYMDDNEDKKCDAKDEDEPHGWKKTFIMLHL